VTSLSLEILPKSLSDLAVRWRTPILFRLLMQLLGIAILTPLFTWVARRLVLASGEPVVSNYDIARFVLTPGGVAFVVFVAAALLGLVLAELLGHTWVAGRAYARREASLLSTVAFVLRRLPALMILSALVFLRLALLALPFLAVAAVVWFGTLAGHDVNYYLAESPPEWRRARWIAVALAVGWAFTAAWQLARWIYALPILAFEGAAPWTALRRSAERTRGRLRHILAPVVLWWTAITLAMAALTWLGRQVTDASFDWAGLDVQRVLPLVALFMAVAAIGALVYASLGLAGQQFLVVRLYAGQAGGEHGYGEFPEPVDPASRSLARTAILATLALAALSVGIGTLIFSRLDLRQAVDVTAHRGASLEAPENSLAAFRAAIDAGATYVELDVQRTRDGVIVVAHDADFMRSAGDGRRVADLTAAEIAAIDIGRKRGERWVGERAPTLEQAIDLARGRIRLNVELKYNVPDPGLAPAVVDLLRRKDFLDQAVITSLDYAALKQVENIDPAIVTGHIVTAAVGNVLRTEADFLSLNTARATGRLVREAHRLGKEIHVWTVNTPDAMLRMVERGVDNVITDDPEQLVRLMRERNALEPAEILGLRLRALFDEPPREVTEPAAVQPL